MKTILAAIGLTFLLAIDAIAQQQAGCLTMNCPTNIVAECNGTNGTVVTFPAPTATTCGSLTSVSCTPPSGSTFLPGTNVVNCVVLDNVRNMARCGFEVIVRDTEPPVIITPRVTNVSCTSPTGAVVNFHVYAQDHCDATPQLTCFPPSGSQFPIGTNTVTCVATDAAGNSSTAAFLVTVSGACDDCVQILCPRGPLVGYAGKDGRAVVDYGATATNLCGGETWLQCNPPSGSSFQVGVTSVSCSAGVGPLPLRTCQFEVRVLDKMPPIILVRSMTVLCQGMFDGRAGANVNLSGITVKDNADPNPHLVCTPPSGSFFPLGTNPVSCVATDAAGNTATTHFSLIVKSGPACESEWGGQTVDLPDNWDFELGLRGWSRTGASFISQPTVGDNIHVRRIPELREQLENQIGGDYWRELAFPVGQHNEHWIGTAENHPDDSTPPGTMQGDDYVGTLMSKPFHLQDRYITFLIGGQLDHAHLRVELMVEASAGENGAVQLSTGWYRAVASTTGHDSERMRRENFDATAFVEKTCWLRIVDDSSTGHLNVDDFRFQPKPPSQTMVKIGGVEKPSVVIHKGLYYDWDSPVWGLTDLHTHPIAHLGMGQRIFHGEPDGLLSHALTNCNENHGGHGLDNPHGNYIRQLVVEAFDGESGANPHQLGWDYSQWTRFRKWPVFTSFSHQQMWFEWIKRSYDGGLRVMVALTVHNKLLAGATPGAVKPYDDVSVMEAQIAELKAFVERHSDFMEIALDPVDLRRIVRNNKLAIIIGSETDDIGNFNKNDSIHVGADSDSREKVRQRLQDLHALGLRYIFPVHLTDNKFSGSAVYNTVFPIATKYYTGTATEVEPVANGIVYRLPDLDLTSHLPDVGQIFGALAEAILNPFAPLKLVLETQSKITGQDTSFSDSSMGMAGIGAAATLPAIVSSPANIVALPALYEFFEDVNSMDLPSDVLPLGGNYPKYSAVTNEVMKGHRNANGLTSLGRFAVMEMMRMGMMVDLDHMSEKGMETSLQLAEQAPGGYPMNFGHNSFRAQRYDASENNRTPDQLLRIRELGGLMGIGWGNGDRRDVGSALDFPRTNSTSHVINNSPGSSKTFAHAALYALEFMKGQQVALGSDINGYVVGPGPRFGPQSAFGMREDEDVLPYRSQYIKDQNNGVAYEPREGRPAASGVFNGKAVDQDKDDQDARKWKGYAYNKQQRDFFVALRIFRWGWQKSPKLTHDEVEEITDGLHDAYDRDRVKEFARGLLLGPTDGTPGKDSDGDVETKQKLAKAVYRKRVLGENPSSEITNDETKNRRYHHFLDVWDDYEGIYGENTPMKRCTTHLVEWDYNFDGLAHYGMMPDFMQDLRNVGLNAEDMSPMFKSAEDFARMWTRCLRVSDAMNHPLMSIPVNPTIQGGVLNLEWYGDATDQLEEADNLGEWRPVPTEVRVTNGVVRATVRIDSGKASHFYRVRK